MGAKAEGWSLLRDKRTGKYTVRFRDRAGKRRHRSTGTRDRARAQREAARIYAEALSGRRRAEVVAGAPLDELCALWLADFETSRAKDTADEYKRYHIATILPFFDHALANVTELACADYGHLRLRQTGAATVRKELSALRAFVEWLHKRGYLPERLSVPGVRKGAIGTPSTDRKQVRVELTRKQGEALLRALPEYGHEKRRVRDIATVLVETGIRRSTLWRLSAPEHYHHGASELAISRDIDKARAGRPLPLTKAARAALDRLCPKGHTGLLTGPVDLRYQLQQASRKIGLPEHLAGRVSYHDLRHAFITDLAEQGASISGIQYLAGHGSAATSARYIHATRRAAEEALALRGRKPAGTPSGTRRATRDTKTGKRR